MLSQKHNVPSTIKTDQTPAPRSAGTAYMAAKASNTQTAYKQALRDFGEAFGITPDQVQPDQITDAALSSYIEARAEDHKPNTIAARVSILRQLANDNGAPVQGDQHRDILKAISREKGIFTPGVEDNFPDTDCMRIEDRARLGVVHGARG